MPEDAKNIVTVVQARCGSTRLPGKVMLPVCGQPLLVRMIERVQQAKHIGTLVVAITQNKEDDKLAELGEAKGWNIYRGSASDLLDRHLQAAKPYQPKAVVKIPSDCPLIDTEIIDRVLEFYKENANKYQYVSNLHPATYPDGNDVEVIDFAALEYANIHAKKSMEREHTTPFFWENPEMFSIGNVFWETGLDYSMSHRFTVDFPDDYTFVRNVFERLYPKKSNFGLEDILQLLDEQPDLFKTNAHLAGVNWYGKHLDELKTIQTKHTKKLEK